MSILTMLSQIDGKLLFAIFGFLFALISFFYKNHETNQLRVLKSISDNIKEINKICIDVFAKKTIDESIYHKISMHLDLVLLDVKTFPTGKFYNCKTCISENRDIVNALVEDYKDLIFEDTPIENKSIDIGEYENSEKRMVEIIQKSVQILEKLEGYMT
ncbi:hypothetical protein M5F03_02545 [Acinetobacter sp. ANC 5579]|uniref:hypothetical protein n=1 Tax=Acinetobacter amyesii TaxID=2942470 RepID=UPI0020BF74F8|nr:hypothetical protein [Acinetobacter amyesii]MCL6234057.1 hypothetical protein [Acinetobacter amyesii]